MLGLKILRCMGIFTKHPRVFIETMDIYSTNPGLASQHLIKGKNGQSKSKYHDIASGVPEIGVAACPTSTKELVVLKQVNRDNTHANVHLDLLSE